MIDALTRGLTATQIGETVADYGLADQPLNDPKRGSVNASNSQEDYIAGDEYFWHDLFRGYRTRARNIEFYMDEVAMSEWVARVPGLYWAPGSRLMRHIKPALIEQETDRWITYRPLGKSQKIMGGIGTLKLQPSPDGYRLVTLTTTLNASAGIPALISPEICEASWFTEGAVLRAKAKWREMTQTWAVQFPSVKGIPRGYFVLERRDQIEFIENGAPIQIHPFSIMEYYNGSVQLLDYVYATAYTAEPAFRSKLTRFFEEYRKADERGGEYLLGADVCDPMWDSWFSSPAELRDSRKASQLRLIEARVQDAVSGQEVVDALIQALSLSDAPTDLQRLSKDAGIDFRRWSTGGSIAEESARLVAEAVRSEKQQALIQVVMAERRKHGMES